MHTTPEGRKRGGKPTLGECPLQREEADMHSKKLRREGAHETRFPPPRDGTNRYHYCWRKLP